MSSRRSSDTLTVLGAAQPKLEELEKRNIRMVPLNTGNKRNEADKKLGISTATLWRRLQQHNKSVQILPSARRSTL